jgi:hypothetical protein
MPVDGESAELFNEMTRETINRKIASLSTDELLDLLGHLILRERSKHSIRPKTLNERMKSL